MSDNKKKQEFNFQGILRHDGEAYYWDVDKETYYNHSITIESFKNANKLPFEIECYEDKSRCFNNLYELNIADLFHKTEEGKKYKYNITIEEVEK